MPLYHLHKHHEHKPLHLQNQKGGYGIIGSVLASSIPTMGFMGILGLVGLPLNVMVPSAAPVWMGLSTMLFSKRM